MSFALLACVFDSARDVPTVNHWEINPGVYSGDYAAVANNIELESEMVLGPEGDFRFTMLHGNTPFYVAKGRWSALQGTMNWKDYLAVYSHSDFDFGSWQSFSPDSSLIRRATDTSFERQEIVYDTVEGDKIRWVPYRRVQPPPSPAQGRFEFSENFRDPSDTARTVTGLNFIEFLGGGKYRDGSIVNGDTVVEFEADHWVQSGSFIITTQNRFRNFDATLKAFEPWQDEPQDYEYIFRVREVLPDSFQSWQTPEASHQGTPYWAHYRRVPSR